MDPVSRFQLFVQGYATSEVERPLSIPRYPKCSKSIRVPTFLMSFKHNPSSNIIHVQKCPPWIYCNFWLKAFRGASLVTTSNIALDITLSNDFFLDYVFICRLNIIIILFLKSLMYFLYCISLWASPKHLSFWSFIRFFSEYLE